MSIQEPTLPAPPRVPQAPSAESILCYRTASAEQLVEQFSAIERVLRAVGRASGGDVACAVTPDRRRLTYLESSAIFRPRSGDLPDSSDEAEIRARQCVREVNVALGRAGVLAAMKAVTFLPEELRLESSSPVYDPDMLEIDHWRCRFRPVVRAATSVPEAEVTDGTIEVSIAEDGRMVGLVAQWRPVTQTVLSSPIAPPDPRDLSWTSDSNERAGLGADTGTHSGDPQVIYILSESPDGTSQLSPYYVFPADPLKRRYRAAQDSAESPKESAEIPS
jgi:hypothetical protein